MAQRPAVLAVTGTNIPYIKELEEALGEKGVKFHIHQVTSLEEVVHEAGVACDAAYAVASTDPQLEKISQYVTIGIGMGSGRVAFHKLLSKEAGGKWGTTSVSWEGGFRDLKSPQLYDKYIEQFKESGLAEDVPTIYVLYAGCWHQHPEETRVGKGDEITAASFHHESSGGWAGGIIPLLGGKLDVPDSRYVCFRSAKVNGAEVYANYLRSWAEAQIQARVFEPDAALYFDVGSKEVGVVAPDAAGLPSLNAKKVKHDGSIEAIVKIVQEELVAAA